MAQYEIPLSFLNSKERTFWEKITALEQVIVQALRKNNRSVVFPVNRDKLRYLHSHVCFSDLPTHYFCAFEPKPATIPNNPINVVIMSVVGIMYKIIKVVFEIRLMNNYF